MSPAKFKKLECSPHPKSCNREYFEGKREPGRLARAVALVGRGNRQAPMVEQSPPKNNKIKKGPNKATKKHEIFKLREAIRKKHVV